MKGHFTVIEISDLKEEAVRYFGDIHLVRRDVRLAYYFYINGTSSLPTIDEDESDEEEYEEEDRVHRPNLFKKIEYLYSMHPTQLRGHN